MTKASIALKTIVDLRIGRVNKQKKNVQRSFTRAAAAAAVIAAIAARARSRP